MREKGVPPVVDTILFLLVDISRHLRSRLSSNRVAVSISSMARDWPWKEMPSHLATEFLGRFAPGLHVCPVA